MERGTKNKKRGETIRRLPSSSLTQLIQLLPATTNVHLQLAGEYRIRNVGARTMFRDIQPFGLFFGADPE
jgi:hypothetical protein